MKKNLMQVLKVIAEAREGGNVGMFDSSKYKN